jgi:hypothetical protein
MLREQYLIYDDEAALIANSEQARATWSSCSRPTRCRRRRAGGAEQTPLPLD